MSGRRLAAQALLAFALLLSVPASAAQRVSLELVLAIDTSLSVDDAEYALQIRGLAAAFRRPEITELIARREGGVAIALLQWSGIADDEDVVWHLLSDARSIEDFAAWIGRVKRWPYGYLTGLGEALLASGDLIAGNAFDGRERKIDVSGDGRSNTGPDPGPARDRLVASGITVNGLAILNSEQGLTEYYQSEVIGGTGAFVIEAADYTDFADAIARKLLRELELDVAELPGQRRAAKKSLSSAAASPSPMPP